MNSNQATNPEFLETDSRSSGNNFVSILTQHEVFRVLAQSAVLPLTHAEESRSGGGADPDSQSRIEERGGSLGTESPDLVSRSSPTEELPSDALRPTKTSFALPPLPQLGPYQLQSLIGVGGHGMVFLATESGLQRKVALKVPRLEWLSQRSFRERFLREAIAVARLNHAGIISIYRFEEQGSLCYIASQYMDGPNLGQWLDLQEQPCDKDLAVRLVARLTDAVQHAHERGVLHRDLKPGNILLEQREDDELPFVPLITDFGLAKLLQEGGEYTLTGAIGLGTPSYMSPEQASGGVVSPATDVYALGMILRTLLTGRAPNSKEASQPVRELPEGLKAIVGHCLEKEPGNRYPSAKALGDDLRRYLAGQPIVRPRLSRNRFLGKPLGIRLSLLTIAVLLSLLAIVGLTARNRLKPSESVEPVGDVQNPTQSPAERSPYLTNLRQSYEFLKENRFRKGMELLGHARQRATPEDLQGFAWRFVENSGNRESQVLSGHQGDVYCSRFSPDGKLLATTGKDTTIRLWEIPSGRLLGILKKHAGEVDGLSFSRDGRFLASAGNHGQIFLWDVASRQLIRPIAGGTSGEEVVGVEFSLDGTRLYSGDRKGLLREWDVATGKQTASYQTQFSRFESIAVSPSDGSIVVTGVPPRISSVKAEQERDGSRTLRPVRDYDPPKSNSALRAFIGTAFSNDGKVLAAVPQGHWHENDVKLWDVESGRSLTSIVGHSRQPSALAFGPDPGMLATAGQDQTIRLWDAASATQRKTLVGHADRIWSVSISPQGDWLASTGESGRVLLWNLDEKKQTFTTSPLLKTFSNLVWAPDGKRLWVCDDMGNLVSFGEDTGPSGTVEDTANTDRSYSIDFSLSPDLNAVVFDKVEEGLKLYSRSSGITRLLIPRANREMFSSRFSPTGQTLLVVDSNFKVTLVDSRSAEVLSEFQAEGTSDLPDEWKVFHPEISNSGKLLAIASRTGLDLWHLSEDRKLRGHRRLSGSEFDRATLRFSHDDKTIACGLANGSLVFVDSNTLRASKPLPAHGEEINDLAFTQDGRTLLTASSDKRVKVWDLVSREEMFTIDGFSGPVRRILFSPDEQALAICTGTVGGEMSITINRLPEKKGK